jgi:glucose/arabinose dehydrogenase
MNSTTLARAFALALITTTPLAAQRGGPPAPPPPNSTNRPVPNIDPVKDAITLNVVDFAVIPDVATPTGSTAPRMMVMVDEPGTRRFFVNEMRGAIHTVSYDGKTVTPYVNINDSTWGVFVRSQSREQGFQNMAFHPQFAQQGTPGYGKFYTWANSTTTTVPADFLPSGGANNSHMVLHEWTAKNAAAAAYDGAAPREVLRVQWPYGNHNGGALAFNPLARPGTPDFGLLYMVLADGGSGGDPNNHAQNLSSAFGKLFRIDPLGKNSKNGKYGIPASNPFVARPRDGALPEIFAYGIRNVQRLAWDPSNGDLYYSEIGQGVVEEVGKLTSGANLGWNTFEGNFGFIQTNSRFVDTVKTRDPSMVYPIVEYSHGDPLIQGGAAASGLVVYRGPIQPMKDKVLFSDLPSGEVFWFDVNNPPKGGSAGLHRVLFKTPGSTEARTILQIGREKNTAAGRANPGTRADTRLDLSRDGRVFLINKVDGVIRVVVP